MSGWERSLLLQLRRENVRRLQIYNGARRDWKVNRDRYQELGLPVPPAPKYPALEVRGGQYWKTCVEWGSAHA